MNANQLGDSHIAYDLRYIGAISCSPDAANRSLREADSQGCDVRNRLSLAH